MKTFGDYIKEIRLERRLTLRAFAETISMDAANYSKLERGKLPPSHDAAKLEPIRKALCLGFDDPQWQEMVRLAAIERGEIPQKILADKELVAKLPALFRTLEGEPIDESVLDELIAAIRRE